MVRAIYASRGFTCIAKEVACAEEIRGWLSVGRLFHTNGSSLCLPLVKDQLLVILAIAGALTRSGRSAASMVCPLVDLRHKLVDHLLSQMMTTGSYG
jgi:hypothetical protein